MTGSGFIGVTRVVPAALFLSCILSVGAVQGANVVILSNYIDGSSGNTVATESYLNTGFLSGSGIETVQVTELFLQFSQRGFQQAAVIDLVVPPGPPWPEKTIIATFEDGTFLNFRSVDAGGNPSVPVTPASNWLGENISLNPSSLIDIPCCSGFTSYALVSHSGPFVVPLPASAGLLLAGFLALRRPRRRAG